MRLPGKQCVHQGADIHREIAVDNPALRNVYAVFAAGINEGVKADLRLGVLHGTRDERRALNVVFFDEMFGDHAHPCRIVDGDRNTAGAVGLALHDDGWCLRQDVEEVRENPLLLVDQNGTEADDMDIGDVIPCIAGKGCILIVIAGRFELYRIEKPLALGLEVVADVDVL